MTGTTISQWLALLAIISVTLLPGAVIGRLTAASIQNWYSGLRKPAWNPPSWLFAPVWTTLYLSMSVAVWMVWRTDPEARTALWLYSIQLALNHLWSPIFFLLRRPAAAFFELCALWVAIALTTYHFAQVCPRSAQLMIPYLAWVSFAGVLNFRIWRDNR